MPNANAELLKNVKQVFKDNQRSFEHFNYTVPSPDSYPYQWFWDSCFHAIILSHFDIKRAKAELRSLIKWQWSSGMMPHMIYWPNIKNTSFPKIQWGKRHTSSLIQPPLLAYATWRIFLKDNDRDFVREMLPHIHRLHGFLLRQRDPRRHCLIGLVHPDESGEDNSPRFDKALGLPPEQQLDENFRRRLKLIRNFRQGRFVVKRRMDKAHWVRDVPVNAILVEDLRCEARLAEAMDDLEGAAWALRHATCSRKAMRTYMLEDGIMWSTLGLDYKLIKVKTWAIFAPLMAELYTQEEAGHLVDNYLLNEKEFATRYPVPTVSVSEKSFDPTGFWRGPTWMATNWFIYQGLMRYGFSREADKIRTSSLELIKKSGFREQFHPMSGVGMGAHNFTWSGLVLDMMEDGEK